MSQSCHSQSDPDRKQQLDLYRQTRMERIARKLLVLSGKGGVGKSTVAAGLARALAAEQSVGLLDIDLHGPSVSRLTGLQDRRLEVGPDGTIEPIQLASGLKVVSIGLLLESADAPVIWRGPMKYGLIEQFLANVNWGPLDVLIVDAPPGTGDEPLAIAELVGEGAQAVIVTTPQAVAIDDVRRSIAFCRQLGLPIAGIIENMAGLSCPHCDQVISLFGQGGGADLAEATGQRLLGSIRIDPGAVAAGDAGLPLPGDGAGADLAGIVEALKQSAPAVGACQKKNPIGKVLETVRIAIPTAEGRLCMHFGHCETFTVLEVDKETGLIASSESLTPPPHEPGVLPRWLAGQNVQLVIAGGMGQRAQGLFAAEGIDVVVGAPAETPEDIVLAWCNGSLEAGENVCDH
ncbi:MAG: iron-sulfur cluster carrier protein MrpORP [Phycisphaerae bacterium]